MASNVLCDWHLDTDVFVGGPRLADMSASLGSFHLCLFGLAPSRKSLLLASIMRTRFQFIGLAGVAVEENDLLRVSGLRHGVLTSGTVVAARVF